ncbi:FUSC family protein [Desulforamulus ferrireducens]|uniref:Membrane-like protein n=1 Tax=Desulforamulus ferrireducens TaxID=1833852 RepID=A0A1S6IVQ7_9FIRM|nr:aromatic acid exporter family protein [Desulforamulus ferrireducens]AQS58859.1 membrane-like protein [Desulforamulus ferrireducens]
MPRLKNLRQKLPFGARMIKTAIAVMISFYIAKTFELNAVVAAVTAIINVQPSLSRSLRNAIEQINVHVLGVCVGLMVGYLWAPGPLAMGLATPLVIWLALRFGFSDVVMALVPMVIILSSPEEAFLTEALYRSLVIFIGVGAGLLVNGLVAPPRYRDILLSKVQQLNNQSAEFFAELTDGFLALRLMPEEEYQDKRAAVKKLLSESRQYLELWKEQLGQSKTPYPWQDKLIEGYIDFNANLYHKSKDIYEMTKARIGWRQQMGYPAITPEFEAILAMLQHGKKDFLKLNAELQSSLFDGKPAKYYPVDDAFWEEMGDFIDLWHTKLSGAYYMHALLFLAVVANNLKFANRATKEFLNTIHENQEQTDATSNVTGRMEED